MTKEFPVLSAKLFRERVYALVEKKNALLFGLLDENLEFEETIAQFKGCEGFVLDVRQDAYLLAIDDRLIAIKNGRLREVLKAHLESNFFRHEVSTKDQIYVQEYGNRPTGIWRLTEDYEDPRLLITNVHLDRGSRHFHYLTYDHFRDWLIVTIGDASIVRAAISKDEGNTWAAIYKGPWQFVPIVPLKNGIVFGMDSGIARGGIAIYSPGEECWRFQFLRWNSRKVKHAQMSDLRLLDNSLWLATFGTPQAVVASEGLNTWYDVYVEGFSELFSYHMQVSEGEQTVVCSTGKAILSFEKSELKNVIAKTQPVIDTDRSCAHKLRGYTFVLKRALKNLQRS